MHKKELNIIVNKEDNAIKRGDFFEEIVSNIFKTQRYTIKERVNFTGMEIDLIAQHIDRKNEIVYIECKARQSLEAKDIKSFAFNTKFKDAQYGYFLSDACAAGRAGRRIAEPHSFVAHAAAHRCGLRRAGDIGARHAGKAFVRVSGAVCGAEPAEIRV